MKLKKKPFNLANKIRTLLLVHINKELLKIKQENKKHFLINSKEPEQYDEYYNTFTIIERSLIDSSSSFLNFFKYQIINQLMKKFYQEKKLQYQKEEMQLLKLKKEIVKILIFI